MKNIYFASSIRGVAFDKKTRDLWLEYLDEYGAVINTSAYDKNNISDKEIYERDISWIKQCDVVVAEITNPSLGVGYELCYAEKQDKPIICYYVKDTNISAMIQGNNHIIKIPYEYTKTFSKDILEKISEI